MGKTVDLGKDTWREDVIGSVNMCWTHFISNVIFGFFGSSLYKSLVLSIQFSS